MRVFFFGGVGGGGGGGKRLQFKNCGRALVKPKNQPGGAVLAQ